MRAGKEVKVAKRVVKTWGGGGLKDRAARWPPTGIGLEQKTTNRQTKLTPQFQNASKFEPRIYS